MLPGLRSRPLPALFPPPRSVLRGHFRLVLRLPNLAFQSLRTLRFVVAQRKVHPPAFLEGALGLLGWPLSDLPWPHRWLRKVRLDRQRLLLREREVLNLHQFVLVFHFFLFSLGTPRKTVVPVEITHVMLSQFLAFVGKIKSILRALSGVHYVRDLNSVNLLRIAFTFLNNCNKIVFNFKVFLL